MPLRGKTAARKYYDDAKSRTIMGFTRISVNFTFPCSIMQSWCLGLLGLSSCTLVIFCMLVYACLAAARAHNEKLFTHKEVRKRFGEFPAMVACVPWAANIAPFLCAIRQCKRTRRTKHNYSQTAELLLFRFVSQIFTSTPFRIQIFCARTHKPR